jgi:hypothetical protein
LAVLVVIAAGFWFLYGKSHHFGEKVYAQAAGHKIYKKDVEDLIGKDKGVSDHNAAEVLADKYLAEAMAKDLKVTVTDKDLVANYGAIINTQKTHDKYQYQYKVNQIYFMKIQAQQRGDYKGKLLVTNFSHNVPFESALLPEQKKANPNIGNPAAIAADKKYAKDLIDSLYNQIESKEITFDQAIQIEHNDPKVGEYAYGALPHSGAFDTSSPYQGRNSLIGPAAAVGQIRKMKPGQISKPFVVSVSNSFETKSSAESYFLVIRLDSASGGQSDLSFAEYLAQAKHKLDYKIYV